MSIQQPGIPQRGLEVKGAFDTDELKRQILQQDPNAQIQSIVSGLQIISDQAASLRDMIQSLNLPGVSVIETYGDVAAVRIPRVSRTDYLRIIPILTGFPDTLFQNDPDGSVVILQPTDEMIEQLTAEGFQELETTRVALAPADSERMTRSSKVD